MKKILYIPLDERPCNYIFPSLLLNDNPEYQIITPDSSIMGNKKHPANYGGLQDFLFANSKNADMLVISFDTLLYGGIVPSRLHDLSEQELLSRLDTVRQIKKQNPMLKIYGFSLIMRCPQYSSSDEEPDYYEDCGREIFLYGEALDKKELNIQEHNIDEKIELYAGKTQYCIEDYLERRAKNIELNLKCINLAKDNVLEFLIIPQDDSSVYGFTAKDQRVVRKYIKNNNLQPKVYMYPGADEVGMVLISRGINKDKNIMPAVSVLYSSTSGQYVVPLYEDRTVGETIKYQILASGCMPVDSVDGSDITMMVNVPSGNMTNANLSDNLSREYNIERNLTEFIEKINYLTEKGKKVAIADIAYVNGGDIEFARLLSIKDLLFKIAAYAGWNTSSNTIGTCLTQAVIYNIFGNTKTHAEFLAHRYFEDVGYCAHTRKYVCDNYLPKLSLNYFNSGEKRGEVSMLVKQEILTFIEKHLPQVSQNFDITDCYMPWTRMFEVGLTVAKRKDKTNGL